jgi:hypothetical protein
MSRSQRLAFVTVAVCLASSAVAADSAVCGAFKKLGWPDQRQLDNFALVDSVMRGAKESATRTFYNIDLDGDDQSDTIQYSCSASTVPADPCLLTATLSSGGKTTFKSWTMRLVRLKGQVYVLSWPRGQARAKEGHRIFHLGARAVTKVCELP